MAKIWYKQGYETSTLSSYRMCGAPTNLMFYYGVAYCDEVEKLEWFRANELSFFVEESVEELNVFDRMHPNTLKEILILFGIEVSDSDTKKEYVAALMELKSSLD